MANHSMTDAACALAESHLELARVKAVVFYKSYLASAHKLRLNFDDFLSAACEALVESARDFQPGGATAFETFAVWRINGALVDTLREASPLGFRRCAEKPVIASLDASQLPTHESPEAAVDSEDAWDHLVRHLDPHRREVMRLRYVFDWSVTAIAQRNGLTVPTVDYWLCSARRAVCDHLALSR